MVHTVGSIASTYYFQRNLQGDVVAIYDKNGALKAKYLYDAWGNCTISSETTSYDVANANPIRYRGHYYDDDTGLYYCNARYYSPKWRRFISPDDTAYLDPESVNGLNLYCYCNNDPVNFVDPSGHEWYDVLGWIGLGLAAAAAIVLTAGLAGAVIGGIAGGIIYGAAIGTLAFGAVGAVGGAVGGLVYDAVNGNTPGTSVWSWAKAGFGIGSISGAVIGGVIGGAAAYSVTGLTNTSFWTGLGKNGANIASQAAAENGLITIGETFGGKTVQFLTNRFGYSATKYLWVSLSKTMASTVSMSSVTLFYGGNIAVTSIFYLYEYPILVQRGIEVIYQLIGA